MDDHAAGAERQAKGLGARHVHDVLRNEILTLTLRPGTVLDETALAGRFAMSRSPVREALVRLSADGLVEMAPNRPTLVATIDLADFPRYVEALDILQRVTTRLAARHRTDSDLARMTEGADAFEAAAASGDDLAMSAANSAFHLAVARAGGNPYLTRSYGQLLDEGRRIMHLHFDYIRGSTTDRLLISEHFAMIDAIRAQDENRADRLAHDHTRQFHDRFLQFLAARFEKAVELD